MKEKFVATVVCGALLAIAGSAGAQQYYGNGQSHQEQRHGQTTHQQYRGERPAPGNRGAAYHGPQKHYRGMYEQGRAEGWYRKGGRLPVAYRNNTYVVSNWSHYHLHRPPRGYHWVRSDNGQFLLVAVTTGVIASIVTSLLSH